MPLDDTWWDPAGPFADNAVGGITAETMRDFARAIGEQGVTGSWFNIMFTMVGITPADWVTPNTSKILWLKKTAEFAHSADWSFLSGTATGDAFIYASPTEVSLQVTFAPSIVHVTNAKANTTVAPVMGLTADEFVALTPGDVHVIGPTQTITSASQNIDIGGWAAVAMADNERVIRFGLKFTPPSGFGIADGVFDIDPTGIGASVVARPLAPAAV